MATIPLSQQHHSQRSHPLHHDPQSAALALAAAEEADRLEATRSEQRHARLHVLGRMLVASLFLITAVIKLLQFGQASRALGEFGAPDSGILLAASIAIELLGGAMLFVGYRVRWASVGLIAYLGVTTLLVNHDLSIALNRAFAVANLAIAGGLVLLAAHGAGGFSLERYVEQRDAKRLG